MKSVSSQRRARFVDTVKARLLLLLVSRAHGFYGDDGEVQLGIRVEISSFNARETASGFMIVANVAFRLARKHPP